MGLAMGRVMWLPERLEWRSALVVTEEARVDEPDKRADMPLRLEWWYQR